MRILLGAVLALHLISAGAESASYLHRKETRQFISEMVQKHGFARRDLDRVFRSAQYQPAIITAMTQPAEVALASWQAYRAIFLKPERIEAGVRFWDRNEEALRRAAAEFGVPEAIIVGIIGVETIYGRNVGTYRAIDALSTLAFDYPKRAEYFRVELENFLIFTRDARIDPLLVKGSYAGAIGIPQFMPGTYRRFALDYDGDGRINLASSAADAIGSIGNFLQAHGWARGEPVALPAQVSGENWRQLASSDGMAVCRAADLPAFGVKIPVPLPADTGCTLIELETQGQPSEFRIGLRNFRVLTRYNRSALYASAVLDLATEVAKARASTATASQNGTAAEPKPQGNP